MISVHEPELLEQPGGFVYVAHVPLAWEPTHASADPSRGHLLVAITPSAIGHIARRGLTWDLGQLYGIVLPGLILTQRLYRGLRRGMYVGQNRNAASTKMAATWPAEKDARWVGSKTTGQVELVDTPKDPPRVFCVYISPNQMLGQFPSIFGWIERWTWIEADPNKSGAPIEWESRYDASLWPDPDVHPAAA